MRIRSRGSWQFKTRTGAPEKDRRLREGSAEAIYVISMEDSEGPSRGVMASLCIRARGIHLNRKSGSISRLCAGCIQRRHFSCRELHFLRPFPACVIADGANYGIAQLTSAVG